jgi:hypothetical protein
MQHIQSSKFLVVSLFATAALTAVAAQTNIPPSTLDARIEKARAEKQIDRRLQALAGVSNELLLAEISGALKAAEDLKSWRERFALRDSALRRWGQLAPAAAFAHVSQMPEGLPKVEAIRSVAVEYGRTNSSAAAAAALKMIPGRARAEAISLISEAWARNNAQEALKWANELPDGPLKQTALRSIYFVWVHSDPVAASATVQNLPPSDTKNALLINVAQNWAVTEPHTAMKWAQALPAEAEKNLAVVIATESWADSDPEAAVEFAWRLPSTELRQRAVLAGLERWATQDPQQAFERIVKSADRLFYEHGIARVLSVCGPVCPELASQWIEQLPMGVIRDAAIENYVEAVYGWHPEAAARRAIKASEPAVRERAVEKTMTLWLKLDPDAAKRWLADTEFSEETKRRWIDSNSTAEF